MREIPGLKEAQEKALVVLRDCQERAAYDYPETPDNQTQAEAYVKYARRAAFGDIMLMLIEVDPYRHKVEGVEDTVSAARWLRRVEKELRKVPPDKLVETSIAMSFIKEQADRRGIGGSETRKMIENLDVISGVIYRAEESIKNSWRESFVRVARRQHA